MSHFDLFKYFLGILKFHAKTTSHLAHITEDLFLFENSVSFITCERIGSKLYENYDKEDSSPLNIR